MNNYQIILGPAWATLQGSGLGLDDPHVSGLDFLNQIQGYFYTPANRNKHKVAFKNCAQGNDTLELYKSRLVQEARLAFPEVKPWKLNSFEVVVDKFIDGLRSEAVQLEVRRGHPRDLEEGKAWEKRGWEKLRE